MTHRRITAGLLSLLLLIPLTFTGCDPERADNSIPPAPTAALSSEMVQPGSFPLEGSGPVLTHPGETPDAETPTPEPAAAEEIWTYCDHFCGAGPLQTWAGYGALLPYVGVITQAERGYEPYTPLYGLCTPRGEMVTDPIYSDVYYEHGFLVLVRGDENSQPHTTIAAQDGSWVAQEVPYGYYKAFDDLVILQDDDGCLYCWNGEGQLFASFPADMFTPWYGDAFDNGSWGAVWVPGRRLTARKDKILYAASTFYQDAVHEEDPLWLYLDLEAGVVLSTPPEGYPAALEDYDVEDYQEMPDGETGFACTDPFTGTQYYKAYAEMGIRLYDAEGKLLSGQVYPAASWSPSPVLGGLTAVISPFAADPYDYVFDWVDLSTGAVVLRYQPERQYQ